MRRPGTAATIAGAGLIAAGAWLVLARGDGPGFPRQSLDADGGIAFVEDASCGECHAAQHEAWTGSHHEQAMQPATDATVAGDFHDATFTQSGDTTRFFQRGSRFFVRTEGPLGTMEDYEVLYTFGVEPLQQYLVAFPGGRLHALTIAWDTRRKTWFSLYPDERISPDDPLRWTGRLHRWNDRCAECHSTGLRVGYDPESDVYQTTWAAVNVGCQACHGPGERHVAWAREADRLQPSSGDDGGSVDRRGFAVDDRGLVAAYRAGEKSEQVFRCARCHSRRGRVSAEDAHGRSFFDDFEIALLREGLYHPDGQILDEVYVTGSFLQSAMYSRGVRCTDCHDPHTARTLVAGNALCTRCHQPAPPETFPTLRAADYDSPEHHRHESGTSGASCIDCHMPPQTYMVVDPRRDHSLRIPRPDLSERLGTPNACTQCHTDRSDRWAADAVRSWYGDSARPLHYGEVIAAGRRNEPGAATQLAALVANTSQPGIVRATAVELLGPHGSSEALDAVVAATADHDPLVRLAGVNALAHAPASERSAVLPALLTDSIGAIRSASAAILAPLAAELTDPSHRQAFDAALSAYRDTQLAQADQPEAQHNLGDVYTALGRVDLAEQAYARAIALDSSFVPAQVNLATLYNRLGRNAEAERLLRRSIALAPTLTELHYSLGLLLAEQGRMVEAVDELSVAAAVPTARPRVHYNLGLALQRVGRMAEAEVALLRAYELVPDDPAFTIALVFYYRGIARWDDAERFARTLIGMLPNDPGPRQLLDEVLAERQRNDRVGSDDAPGEGAAP